MIVELINTGSELMLGRVLNTHQQWLCRKLADLGYTVSRQIAIADNGKEITQAVAESLQRADLIITTGGLGPTSDDLTRELVAQLLDKKLHEDNSVLENIKRYFAARSRPLPDLTRVQAQVPDGAIVLPNAHGTAPGLAMEATRAGRSNAWIVMLPGPPRELRPTFDDAVVPLLRRVLPLDAPSECLVLRTCGIGESVVQQRIAGPLQHLVDAGLDLGYCAKPWQVDVRLAASGPARKKLVAEAEAIVRPVLDRYIFATGDTDLPAVIIKCLTDRNETLALAESCTGGLVSHQLTNVPGASRVLMAGLVTYANSAKEKFLGVAREALDKHGAVSAEVARQMAEGARREAGANYALAITGIAGPSGGTAEKPVGTVFIALAGEFQTEVERKMNPFDRATFKEVTALQALDLLRKKLLR